MTIAEAIENREACLKYLEKLGPQATPECVEAVRMSIAALRAQQTHAKLDRSRWEGCDWCNQRYCDNCFWQIKMKDSFRCKRCTDKSEWSSIVSYCSNCGRPITEEAWAELERRVK